jgi:hypothetical protein
VKPDFQDRLSPASRFKHGSQGIEQILPAARLLQPGHSPDLLRKLGIRLVAGVDHERNAPPAQFMGQFAAGSIGQAIVEDGSLRCMGLKPGQRLGSGSERPLGLVTQILLSSAV